MGFSMKIFRTKVHSEVIDLITVALTISRFWSCVQVKWVFAIWWEFSLLKLHCKWMGVPLVGQKSSGYDWKLLCGKGEGVNLSTVWTCAFLAQNTLTIISRQLLHRAEQNNVLVPYSWCQFDFQFKCACNTEQGQAVFCCLLHLSVPLKRLGLLVFTWHHLSLLDSYFFEYSATVFHAALCSSREVTHVGLLRTIALPW